MKSSKFLLSTLVAAAAMTSSAYAVTFSDGTGIGYGSITDDGKFSVALSLNVETLRTYLEKNASAVTHTLVGYSAGGTQTGVTTNYEDEDVDGKINTSGLYYIWGTDLNWGPNNTDVNITATNIVGGTTTAMDLATIEWDSVAGAGLVYTFDSEGGTKVGFSLVNSAGEEVYAAFNNQGTLKSRNAGAAALTFDGVTTKAVYFANVLNEDEVKSIAKEASTSQAQSQTSDSFYTWNGTESSSTWNTTDAIWSGGKVYRNDGLGHVTFDSSASGKNVVVGSDIVAGVVSVSDSYAFSIAENATLSVASLTVSSGNVTFSGLGNVSVGTLNVRGSAEIAFGDTNAAEISTINVSSGTSKISGKVNAGTLNLTGGALKFTSGKITSVSDTNARVGISMTGGSSLAVSGGVWETTLLSLNDVANSDREASVSISGGEVLITGIDKNKNKNESQGGNARLMIGHWGGNATHSLTLSGGILNAVDAFAHISWTSRGKMSVSGGEANLYGLYLKGQADDKSAEFLMTNGRVNLGEGGIISATNSAKVVKLSGGTVGALDSWRSSANIQLGGTVTIDTTNMAVATSGGAATEESGSAGVEIELTGILSDVSGDALGSLKKVGAGTLKLSGENTYSGGTEILGGVLEVADASALGGADVSVEISGGELKVSGVELAKSAITIKFTEDNVENYIFGFGGVAVSGDEAASLATGTTITLDVDQAALDMIAQNSWSIGYMSSSLRDDEVTVSLSDELDALLAQNNLEMSYGSFLGMEYFTLTPSIPEPSAFGLLAGIGALALVASRRRRK